MLLLNDFYTVSAQSTTESSATFSVALNSAHPIFKAHFPGNPIVPGVCQLAMVEELAGECLKRRMQMVRLSNVKYLSVLTPVETASLDVVLTAVKTLPNGDTSVKAELRSGDRVFTKMSLELR